MYSILNKWYVRVRGYAIGEQASLMDVEIVSIDVSTSTQTSGSGGADDDCGVPIVLCRVSPRLDTHRQRPQDELPVVHLVLAELEPVDASSQDWCVARTFAVLPPTDVDVSSATLVVASDVCFRSLICIVVFFQLVLRCVCCF